MPSLQPIITEHRLEAFMARALFWLHWLIGVVDRIAPINGSRRLHAYIDRAERWIEYALFLKAAAQVPPPPQRRRPRSTPHGFRRVRGSVRLFMRSVRIRHKGTLAERLANLAAVLNAPERAVAHFIKRLLKGVPASRLVAASPAADALHTRDSTTVAFADSS